MPKQDLITTISNTIDNNLSIVRAGISVGIGISLISIISFTRHGSRIKQDSALLSTIGRKQGKLYGKLYPNDLNLFYHEPLFIRIFLGRTKQIKPANCIRFKYAGLENTKFFENSDYLQLKLLGNGYAIPFIRLKWYHPWRTNMLNYLIKTGLSKLDRGSLYGLTEKQVQALEKLEAKAAKKKLGIWE
ncbi:hypothetical protein HDV06_002177 [Boothiomyces sp. JEL0866]|nr:hypothetical protein HDV06_002177 [Boothiomyces sp. JEL0866]